MGANGEITKRQKILEMIGKDLILVGGNAMYAVAIVLFVMPSGLVTGGVTGISIMIGKATGIEVSYFVFLINIALFIWGSAVLGKHFCVTTAASTVLYPGFLYIFQRVFADVVLIENDLVLCAAAAGVMICCGNGGTDGFFYRGNGHSAADHKQMDGFPCWNHALYY